MNPAPGHLLLRAAALLVAIGLAVAGLSLLLGRGPSDPTLEGYEAGGDVRRVSGDFIKLKDGRQIEFAAIRLPYEGEPHAAVARRVLDRWLRDEGVRLLFDEYREYKKGRQLAYVYANDTFINERLARDGLAFVKLRAGNRRHAETLLAAQAAAQAEGRGIWAELNPSMEGDFAADPERATFHLPGCPDLALAGKAYMTITNTQDAFSRGMAPCGRCRPCQSAGSGS